MNKVSNEKGVSARWNPETISKTGRVRKAIRVGKTF
jgi:hypothetical protein